MKKLRQKGNKYILCSYIVKKEKNGTSDRNKCLGQHKNPLNPGWRPDNDNDQLRPEKYKRKMLAENDIVRHNTFGRI